MLAKALKPREWTPAEAEAAHKFAEANRKVIGTLRTGAGKRSRSTGRRCLTRIRERPREQAHAGAWVVREDSDGALYVATKSAGIFIAQVTEPVKSARKLTPGVIAAAPDLLEAVEEAVV